MIEITENKIDIVGANLVGADPCVCPNTCGAVVTFEGRVRDHNDGKKVLKLFYDCYKPMAKKVLEEIRSEAISKWDIEEILVVHRIGEIPIGEISVWIAVLSAHREQAFEAAKYMIDELKQRVPIWKQETYTDGTKVWVEECCHASSLKGHDGRERSIGLSSR